jgi:hypothetical protein
MNYIGIDPSITSTGMTINGKMFSYSYEENVYTKKGNLTKWFASCEHIVNLKLHNRAIFDTYKNEQIIKLKLYKDIIEKIISDIESTIEPGKTKIAIEGYSYGSETGYLIDLVTFGTLLRERLLDITEDIEVIAPSSLKLESCKLVYDPITIKKGKRKIEYKYRNNEGISGGNFTKVHMCKAILESEWDEPWVKYLKSVEKDFATKIPKPHEDLNDSFLLYKYISTL